MMDPRYRSSVAGMEGEQLATALRKSIDDVAKHFPQGTGICVFVFDFEGDKGMGYISNAERDVMVKALREFLNKEARKS